MRLARTYKQTNVRAGERSCYVGLLPVHAAGARARVPGGGRAARHRGPAQGEEGPLEAVPPLEDQILHALRCTPLLQGIRESLHTSLILNLNFVRGSG